MSNGDRTALVLYGSETGNAQDMAEELGRLCQRLHFASQVKELDATDLNELLQHELVLFVLSTTGQGDMPHNSLLFWKKLLRKRLPPACLGRLKYTCVGLGDSTYLKFNWAARKLIRRLDQLGAEQFFEPCEADEQFPEGIDGSFVRWADDLYKHLLRHLPDPGGRVPIGDDEMLPPKWTLAPAIDRISSSSAAAAATDPPRFRQDTTLPSIASPPLDQLPLPGGLRATLRQSRRMTPDSHWQDVRLLSFDVDEAPPQINPGDCLTIYPRNFPEDVQTVISLMNWDDVADEPLDLSVCPLLPPSLHAIPSPCTIRRLLLHNVDINAVPRRSFLKNLSYFASNRDHQDRLREFAKTEFLDEYFDYATRSRRTITEVLEEFHSVRVPPERILDVFPLIRGRDFSIANYHHDPSASASASTSTSRSTSPSASGARIDLLVALVKYRTILRKPRQGLCSRYLAHLPASSPLTVTIKPVLSPIHGPSNAQRPLVAMVTGTGIAPIRALIQERSQHPHAAPVLLFFGNRNRDADYFFQHEWDSYYPSVTVHTAFSRDQREKIYVQDLVRQEADHIAQLVPKRPIFAVCGGSSKMAEACKRAVFEPFTNCGGRADEEAAQRKLLDEATWWQEIWFVARCGFRVAHPFAQDKESVARILFESRRSLVDLSSRAGLSSPPPEQSYKQAHRQ